MPSDATPPIAVQFGWYLLVGGLCTVVDLGGFWLLTGAGVPLMLAAPASYLTGTVAHYFLSYLLVFQRGRHGRAEELGRLALVSLVGLGLNSLAVYGFVQLGASGLLAKTVAVPCVLGWNFLARRAFVFQPVMPEVTREVSERAIDRWRGGA
jgi:putative flippase GtrA